MQKIPRFKSRKYLDFVKSLPCANCHSIADEAHHIIGVGGLSGMGLTAPDWATMPLCRPCHSLIHTTPELWPLQWEWVARTMAQAIINCKTW